MPHTICTIGYQGTSLSEFVLFLVENGIETLIDVRDYPFSRKPGFSKTPLREAVTLAGIDYVHSKDLGCPQRIRHAFRDDPDWDRYSVEFLEHLDGQEEALKWLLSFADRSRICLMCFEADPLECHRSLVVGRALSMRPGKVEVEHLHPMRRAVSARTEPRLSLAGTPAR